MTENDSFDISGGVNMAEAVRKFQGLRFAPSRYTLCDSEGMRFQLKSLPATVKVFFNGDMGHPLSIAKAAFMNPADILADVKFYLQQSQERDALKCAEQGLYVAKPSWPLLEKAIELQLKFGDMKGLGRSCQLAHDCEECPRKTHMLCQAANAYTAVDERDKALNLLLQGLLEEPRDSEVLCALGDFYLKEGSFQAAGDFFMIAMESNPGEFAAYEALSDLCAIVCEKVGAAELLGKWSLRLSDCSSSKSAMEPAEFAAMRAELKGFFKEEKLP